MYLLVMVLDNVSHLNDVLDAWTKAGVPGITVLESTGVHRVLQRQQPEAAFAGFSQIFGGGRIGHHTLLSVVDELEVAERAVAATEKIVGSLQNKHTGIAFAVPIAKVWGVLYKTNG